MSQPTGVRVIPGAVRSRTAWLVWVAAPGSMAYSWLVSLDGGTSWRETGDSAAGVELAGLVPGREYRFSVRARLTQGGVGLPSVVLPWTAPDSNLTANDSLVIGQWRNARTLRAVIAIGIDAWREHVERPLNTLELMTDISRAEGRWLDAIGGRLGLQRPWVRATLVGAADRRWGFDSAGVGFDQGRLQGDPINDAIAPLPDALYRRFLRARAEALKADGTIGPLGRAIRQLDPNAPAVDRHDMTVETVVDADRKWQVELARDLGVIPLTAGVRLIIRTRGKFGFDSAGTGFDLGGLA